MPGSLDSTKNKFYIKQTPENLEYRKTITQNLRLHHKSHFAHKLGKSKDSKLCIVEFVDTLIREDVCCTYKQLIQINQDFFQVIHPHFQKHRNLYYDRDQKLIDCQICFTTKRNNFISYLKHRVKKTSVYVTPTYQFRKIIKKTNHI